MRPVRYTRRKRAAGKIPAALFVSQELLFRQESHGDQPVSCQLLFISLDFSLPPSSEQPCRIQVETPSLGNSHH